MAKESKNSNKNVNVEDIKDKEERAKALDDALKQIEKDFGKGSVMKLGDKANLEIETLSIGSLSIDLAIGIGGLPKGRIVEIYGPESSGKTTVTLHAVAEAQKNGGIAAFIDAEYALDPVYAKAIGVNVDDLIVSQPDTGEQALEIAEALIRSGAIDLIVVDSVAALVPKAEIEGDMGDSHIGLQARLMSQALRKLTGSIQKSNCIAIFINQLREKVGGYGNPETTTGGRALKFYSSVRLDVRKIDTIKQGDKVMGSRTRVKVVKNKVSSPFTQCEFDIMYGEGISKTGEVLDIATDKDIVKKSGAWYSYDDAKLGQGREKVKQFLDDNKDLLEEIEQKVREMCVIKQKVEYEEVESENIENRNIDTEKKENKTENIKENNISSINQTGTDRIL